VAKSKNDKAKVTRITASDTPKAKKADKPTKKVAKKPAKAKKVRTPDVLTDEKRPLWRRFFGYFTGAWYELRQVHWPNRRATWSLTGAVLAFTAFFVVFIMLLDALFKFLFETILK